MKVLLIDLDGVLRLGEQVAPGVQDLLRFIQEKEIATSIVSNTTKLRGEAIYSFFATKGVDLGNIAVLTALDATLAYVQTNYSSVKAYCEAEARTFFQAYQKGGNPEAVVIGDMGEAWTYATLNQVFTEVRAGADIIAMQMNRFWKHPERGFCLDAGAFVKAIEFASQKEAVLVGKPSRHFFQQALEKINATSSTDFVMLGDGLYSDIQAAQAAGGQGLLVLSGKTQREDLEDTDISPDGVVENLEEAVAVLREWWG